MPTGRITFPGGVSAPSIHVPIIPGNARGVKDGANSSYDAGGRGVNPQPNIDPGYGTGLNAFYATFVPEIAKANFVNPSNQGRLAEENIRSGYMPAKGVNTPSRSQFSEGYTAAIQVFSAPDLRAAGGTSTGKRASQPSTKFVSPFSSLPIPTRMPWDL